MIEYKVVTLYSIIAIKRYIDSPYDSIIGKNAYFFLILFFFYILIFNHRICKNYFSTFLTCDSITGHDL